MLNTVRLFKLRQMETQREQMKGVLPCFNGLVVLVQEIFVLSFCLVVSVQNTVFTALVVSVQSSINNFFLTVDYFISFVPIYQAGQAVVLGRISLNMCICLWV